MYILMLLDTHRNPQTVQVVQAFCQWHRKKKRPITLAMGADKATTMSLTAEKDDIFYNAQEFVPLSLPILENTQNTHVFYIHQGRFWEYS